MRVRTPFDSDARARARTPRQSDLTRPPLRCASSGFIAFLGPVAEAWASLSAPTADTCEDGLVIAGPTPSILNIIIFMSLLLWSFVGVAIAADIFMVAIEYITSQTITRTIDTPTGKKPMTIYIWNGGHTACHARPPAFSCGSRA